MKTIEPENQVKPRSPFRAKSTLKFLDTQQESSALLRIEVQDEAQQTSKSTPRGKQQIHKMLIDEDG